MWSDPYTGMAILYRYLYVMEYSNRSLILWFPNINKNQLGVYGHAQAVKNIRLYKIAADGILFVERLPRPNSSESLSTSEKSRNSTSILLAFCYYRAGGFPMSLNRCSCKSKCHFAFQSTNSPFTVGFQP